MNTEDFTYKGYFIPKDTVIVLNTVRICQDTLCRLTNVLSTSGRCITIPSDTQIHMNSRFVLLCSSRHRPAADPFTRCHIHHSPSDISTTI